jgi:hypothetical protein
MGSTVGRCMTSMGDRSFLAVSWRAVRACV